jgi:hypothetical protein
MDSKTVFNSMLDDIFVPVAQMAGIVNSISEADKAALM